MVPDFFIGVPIRRILRQVKHMESRLSLNVGFGCLGNMRRRLIHHNYQMAPRMMPQHLPQKLDHFDRRYPLIVQSENQLASASNRRHSRYPAALAGHALFRRDSAWCPCLAQQCGQRDVGFILKVQNGPVFLDRSANFRQLVLPPCLAFFLRQFEILSLRLLIAQARFMEAAHHRLLRDQHAKLAPNDLDQSRRSPEICLKTKRRRRRHYNRSQRSSVQTGNLARAPWDRSALQSPIPFGMEARQPAMQGSPVGPIGLRDRRYRHALFENSSNRPRSNLVSRITQCQLRSVAHEEYCVQLHYPLSIPMLQNYWNGLYQDPVA